MKRMLCALFCALTLSAGATAGQAPANTQDWIVAGRLGLMQFIVVPEVSARDRAYYDRFVFSQTFAQVDPWSERVSGKDKHEFKPMATIGFSAAAE